MYSEGIDRLTVYGSSNIESKIQANLKENTLYTVFFCDSQVPLFEGCDLSKEAAVQQVIDYLDFRFAVINFRKDIGSCTLNIINTDFTIEVVGQL